MNELARSDSLAWKIQTWLAFILSHALLLGGIVLLPVELWLKGYLAMGAFFALGSTISLVKTIRDAHEQRAYHHRLEQARSARLLKEFELESAGTPAAVRVHPGARERVG